MLSRLLKAYSLRRFNRNIQLFLLFSIPFFAALGVFTILYNLYLLRLGFQEDFIGRLAGMMPLASGLFAFPVGLWSDRVGRKPFLIAGAFLLGASQVGLCFVRDPSLLLALSFLAGISTACMFVNHVPFLAENSRPENRGHAISMAFGIQVLTRMTMSLVAGSLPAVFAWMTGVGEDLPEPFRYALLLGVFCSFAAAAPMLRVRPGESTEGTSGEASPTASEDPVPFRILAKFLGVSSFRGLAFGLSMPFFNVFFDDALHASAAAIGVIFFGGHLLGFPSSMSAPALAHRFGPVRCIVPLRVLAASCLWIFGGLSDLLMGVGIFFVISMVDNLTTPMEMTFATNVVSRGYWGRIQSLRVTGFQVLAAGGSIWAGEMILRHGYELTFAVSGAATLASGAALLAGFGWRPLDRDTPGEQT